MLQQRIFYKVAWKTSVLLAVHSSFAILDCGCKGCGVEYDWILCVAANGTLLYTFQTMIVRMTGPLILTSELVVFISMS